MSMNAVKITGLVKAYGRKRAIDGLSVEIAENRITGLIGRNGAGKTTLLKLIAGYSRPTGGEVAVYGKKPFNNLAVSSNMIFVDDSMVFPHALNLGEIMTEMQRFYRSFDTVLAGKLLEYYGIDRKLKTAKLSKGMRSAFYSIIGIAARAAVTIFDEPTTGMDAAVRKDFYRVLLKEYIEYPRTVLLSSHLLGELSGLLEDIILLDSGRLVDILAADEAEAYAAGLRGPESAVLKIAGGRQILHREELAPGMVFLAVKTPLTPEEALQARELGLEVLPVKAEDLCIYLTENGKGGIDDALRRE
jgi:ABC-2 type transport system ATP-binding protein